MLRSINALNVKAILLKMVSLYIVSVRRDYVKDVLLNVRDVIKCIVRVVKLKESAAFVMRRFVMLAFQNVISVLKLCVINARQYRILL